jgi:hypothetical protein
MMNGEKLLVREAPDTLVERTRDFKRSLLDRAPFTLERRNAAGAGRSLAYARLEEVNPSPRERAEGDR